MANLNGQNIGTNYKGFLNLDSTINTPLDATLRAVTDGMGNSSVLKLSTAQVAFGAFTGATTGDIVWRANGTLTEYTGWHQSDGEYKLITKNASPIFINIANGLNFANGFSTQGGFNSSGFYVGTSPTQNGQLTVKGSGSNILSLRNSSNVEKVFVSDTGELGAIVLYCQNIGGSNGGAPLSLFNYSGLLQFLGGTSSYPAIKRNGAAIDFRLADDSNYTSVNASLFTANYVGSQVALNIFDTDRQIGTGGAGHIGFKASAGFTFSNVNFNVATTSAMVEITSTTKGFLPPRMTTGEINAIATPAAGLQVYNTDLAQPCFYDGAGWRKISHSAM